MPVQLHRASHVGLVTYSGNCQKDIGRQDHGQCYSAVTFLKKDFFFFSFSQQFDSTPIGFSNFFSSIVTCKKLFYSNLR